MHLDNAKIRAAITKMRISAHSFPIETGRYENKSRENRICPLCCNGIGDEKHYLFECDNTNILDKRIKYCKKIYDICPQMHNLSTDDKFKYIIGCTDETILKDTGILFLIIQKEFENITD